MTILILVVLLMAASAFATNTRVLTMGDNNRILLDEANIHIFPSRLYDYGDLAVAEFDNNDMMEFGVHWKFNDDNPWVLGTYLHHDGIKDHPYDPFANSAPLGHNKRIDLFYGRMLGDHKFGFHVGLLNSSDTDDKPTDKSEQSLSVWNFDFGLTPDGDDMDISLGLEMMSFSDKDTYQKPGGAYAQYDKTKPEGNMAFYVMARKFREVNKRTTIIPHAELRFGKYERGQYSVHPVDSTVSLGQTVKNNTFVLDAGMGMEYTPANNVLAVIDFGLMYNSLKTETTISDTTTERTDKTLTLPYFKIGFDADIFKWLDVRFGATSYWNNQTIEAGDAKDEMKMPDNETYLGFGFHWNRLHVDVQANPALIHDGFNFISGRDNDMNMRVSAVYEMM